MKESIVHILVVFVICNLFLVGCMGLEWIVNDKSQKEQWQKNPSRVTVRQEAKTQNKMSHVKLVENEEVVGYEDRAFYRFFYEEAQADNVAVLASKLQEKCLGVEKIYVMPIPTRIISEEGYTVDKNNYENFVNRITQQLPEKCTLLDVSKEMLQHNSEEIFYPTENTWTSRGAYYGSQIFLNATGRKSIPLEQYEEYVGNRFKGKVESQKDISAKKESGLFQADNVLYYYWLKDSLQRTEIIKFGEQGGEERYKKPLFTPSSANLCSVIEDDYDRAIVEGESLDGKNTKKYLLVINDRAGSWMVPYLKDYYDGVYVINIHKDPFLYRDMNQIIEEYQITELLWVQNASELGKMGYAKALSMKEWGI